MSHQPSSRRCGRTLPVLALLLTGFLTGCTAWSPVAQPWPESLPPKGSDSRVRIEMMEGKVLIADSARARPDTVIAWTTDFTTYVPLSQVRKMEVRRFSALKSVPAFLGVGVALAALGCALACDVSDCIGCGIGIAAPSLGTPRLVLKKP